MLPGIDLRLENVLKALREVVLPAIPTDQRLARDQAMLAIGHVEMVAGQWRHAARYEAGSLHAMTDLAVTLVSEPDAAIDDERRRAITTVLSQARSTDGSDLAQTERLVAQLGDLLDAVILDAGRPGRMPTAVIEAVLAYGDAQARRERIWFAATRLDPDVDLLDDIGTMLAAG